MSKNVTGLVFTCDHSGIIQEVLTDNCGLLTCATGCHLEEFTEPSSKPKVSGFLEEVITKGAAFLWEMALPKEHGYEVLNFFGGRKNGTLFILAAPAPHSIFTYYDELMRVINDQGTMLRSLQRPAAPPVKESSPSPTQQPLSVVQLPATADTTNGNAFQTIAPQQAERIDDSAFSLDEFMRLNNELLTVQRELTRKNHQLQEQEERFRKIIQENVDALFVVDPQGKILFANPAATKLMACDSGDLTGRPFPFSIKEKQYCEVDIPREDQTTIPCSMRHTPIQWEKADALLVSLRDITARKEAEMMREEVERITRHDLKSPLQGVIGLPELLLLDDNLTEQQREALTLIRESGLRMMNVINNSLNLHKMESGLYDFVPESVELLSLLNDVLSESAVIFRRKKISTVRIRINGIPPSENTTTYLSGERLLLYSLFSNLLVNAAEASPPDQPVEISIRTGETVEITIRNNGAVPPEIRDTFFDKYVSRGKKFGTGLGTYAARLIARTNGGDVVLDARNDTTTLIVSLPRGIGKKSAP